MTLLNTAYTSVSTITGKVYLMLGLEPRGIGPASLGLTICRYNV